MRWLRFLPVFAFIGPASAAPTISTYDGKWEGSATVTSGRCQPATVALTVEGKIAVGTARFRVESQNINGTVSEDGTLGATIGFRHLTGQFTQEFFEGNFNSSDCAWKMILRRRK
jgi:hypothetical protein